MTNDGNSVGGSTIPSFILLISKCKSLGSWDYINIPSFPLEHPSQKYWII